MIERTFWAKIRAKVGHLGHFSRVESLCTVGYPDVDYCVDGVSGKIELKYKREWPKKTDTPVFLKGGLREAQVVWIENRVRAGGLVWILAGVDDSMILIHGRHASMFNKMNQVQLINAAAWIRSGRLSDMEWVEFLQKIGGE